MKIVLSCCFVFFAFIAIAQPVAADRHTDGVMSQAALRLQAGLSAFLDHAPNDLDDPNRAVTITALARFYKQRDYQIVWLTPDGLLPQGTVLIETVRHAGREGLHTPRLALQHLDRILSDLSDTPTQFLDLMIQADLMLTEMALNYATHISRGQIGSQAKHTQRMVNSDPIEEDIGGQLLCALDQRLLESYLSSLGPRHAQYRTLKACLARYETIKQLGGWPQVPDGPKLMLGHRAPRVVILRQRLMIAGDLPIIASSSSDIVDADLMSAVKRFQSRHGIQTDGIVGPDTLSVLNVPVQQRIDQIRLNMERWRWMPRNLGPQYLMVNIPSFELKIVENGSVVNTMRAIVGKSQRPTPVMSGRMTHMELNPYWNIPQKIARTDILPKIQNDPGYIQRAAIEVLEGWQPDERPLDPKAIDWSRFSYHYLPYRLRQQPSAHNALGKIKFMFPNRRAIYIHDTPGKSLFELDKRTFSSGCVRVEDPIDLARYLLKRQQSAQKRLAKAIKSQKHRVILLNQTVPVHLVYFTVWMDKGGCVNFLQDIYQRDRDLQAALSLEKNDVQLCSRDILKVMPAIIAGEAGDTHKKEVISSHSASTSFQARTS